MPQFAKCTASHCVKFRNGGLRTAVGRDLRQRRVGVHRGEILTMEPPVSACRARTPASSAACRESSRLKTNETPSLSRSKKERAVSSSRSALSKYSPVVVPFRVVAACAVDEHLAVPEGLFHGLVRGGEALGVEQLACTATASPPFLRISAAAASAASGFKSSSATLWPSAASAFGEGAAKARRPRR